MIRRASAGPRVGRIEALVRIRAAGEVGVGGDLPARQVDRLQARLDHLHGLASRHRAQGRDPLLLGEEATEPLGTEPGERVLDDDAPAQPLDVIVGVRAVQGRSGAHVGRTPLENDLGSRFLCFGS